MRPSPKSNPIATIIVVFILCFTIRFIEAFVLRLDETVLGGNVLHKLFGIGVLIVVLKLYALSWKVLGFDLRRFYVPALLGLTFGFGRLALGYAAEYAVLSASGENPAFSFYLSGFSLAGSAMKLPTYSIVFTLAFEIINAIMEEGLFRGLFIKLAQQRLRFAASNLTAAMLFGLWHIVMPIRSYLDGEMPFAAMLFYCIGYLVLSGIMSLIWGALFGLSGVLWIGLIDHVINNTLIGAIHITTSSGIDELQLVRSIVSQLVLLSVVFVCYARQRRTKRILV